MTDTGVIFIALAGLLAVIAICRTVVLVRECRPLRSDNCQCTHERASTTVPVAMAPALSQPDRATSAPAASSKVDCFRPNLGTPRKDNDEV